MSARKPLLLMLDSGAFSAYQSGTPITVKEYAAYIEKHWDAFQEIVNLDVIPSGRDPAAYEAAAEQSWKNWNRLCKTYSFVMPVFHYGENFSWLKRILDAQPKNLGLGGIAKAPRGRRDLWLRQVFSVICGSKKYPHLPVHGFGVSDEELLRRYPFSSADSISWMSTSSYGSVWVRMGGRTITVKITDGERGARMPARHWHSLTQREQHVVRSQMDSLGVDFDKLFTKYQERRHACIRHFQSYVENHPVARHEPVGTLTGNVTSSHGADSPATKTCRFYFGCGTSPTDSVVPLNRAGVRRRLFSYVVLRRFPDVVPSELVASWKVRGKS